LWRDQQAVDAWYVATYDALSEAELDETVRFTFVGGGDGAMTRGEILLHLVNHTSYHRGFVAEMFTASRYLPDHRLAGVFEGSEEGLTAGRAL